jgi:protein-disulfide isomerase
MSEFKGTKGKWNYSKEYLTIVDQDRYGIAQENGIRNSSEWEANALLISKAPEMLEMLNEILLETDPHGQSKQYNKIEQLIKEATEL